MRFSHVVRRIAAGAAVAAALAAPGLASAKGFVLFNTGSELFEVADFPSEVTKSFPAAAKYKLGYKCNHFGLFWADVWTWNCEQVAVDASLSGYADLPDQVKATMAQKYTMSDAKRGFWNHYAAWVVLALVAGFFGLGLLPDRKPADTKRPAEA